MHHLNLLQQVNVHVNFSVEKYQKVEDLLAYFSTETPHLFPV